MVSKCTVRSSACSKVKRFHHERSHLPSRQRKGELWFKWNNLTEGEKSDFLYIISHRK